MYVKPMSIPSRSIYPSDHMWFPTLGWSWCSLDYKKPQALPNYWGKNNHHVIWGKEEERIAFTWLGNIVQSHKTDQKENFSVENKEIHCLWLTFFTTKHTYPCIKEKPTSQFSSLCRYKHTFSIFLFLSYTTSLRDWFLISTIKTGLHSSKKSRNMVS